MDFTLEALQKRKCMICGETRKSMSNVMLGQSHIATVTVCCNCGLTLTFSHSAQEYAKYLETGEYDYNTEICSDPYCKRADCPKIMYGRKL